MGRNIRLGVTGGLAFAACYGVIALAVWTAGGGAGFGPQETGLFTILVLYLLGGLTAGVIVGVLMPVGRTLVGAMIVGLIAAVPLIAGFHVTLFGTEESLGFGYVMQVIFTGPPAGALLWFILVKGKGVSRRPG